MGIEFMFEQNTGLRATFAAFAGHGFAVIDGAQFRDLPAELRRERLFARSLFLDHVDAEMQKAGPWLVSLGQAPQATDQVFAVVGEKPAVVYWDCAAGGAVLYRHLRSINMVCIPIWVAEGKDEPSSPAEYVNRRVFFRHFDPRVLGALMPCLDAAQFARFLGPTREVAFFATDFGGLRRIVDNIDLPPAPPGPLTIRSERIRVMLDRRLQVSRTRIRLFIKNNMSAHLANLSDEDLTDCIISAEKMGKYSDAQTEEKIGRLALVIAAIRSRGYQI